MYIVLDMYYPSISLKCVFNLTQFDSSVEILRDIAKSIMTNWKWKSEMWLIYSFPNIFLPVVTEITFLIKITLLGSTERLLHKLLYIRRFHSLIMSACPSIAFRSALHSVLAKIIIINKYLLHMLRNLHEFGQIFFLTDL